MVLNFSGGTRTLSTGSNVTGLGTLSVSGAAVTVNNLLGIGTTGAGIGVSSGTLTIGVPTSIATLNLSGGTLAGTGNVTVTGAFNVTGSSTLSGTGTVTTQGTSTVSMAATNGSFSLTGGKTLVNEGTFTVGGDDYIYLGYASGGSNTLTNAAGGTFNLSSSFATPISNWSGTSVFSNAGTLNQTVTGVHAIGSGVTFNNAGTVNVTAGTLSIGGSFATNSGTINVATGTSFQNAGGFTNAGTVQGFGSVDVGTGNTLTNNGIIAPGTGVGGVGALSITGNLNLTGGTVNIDLGGTGGGLSDTVAVTGNVTMGGTLNATKLAGYTPSNADAIPFLTMTGTASGTFSPATLPASFSPGYNLAINEGARLIYAVAGTRTFNNSQSNLLWSDALNWTGGAPGAGDSALISGTFAVNHSSGTDTILGLTVNSGNSLAISGGSLAVTGATSVGGVLTVSGGTLALNGTSTVATLGMTSGALNGIGNLTVASAFNYSGGSVGLTGALDITHTGNLTLPVMTSLASLLAKATGDLTLNGSITTSGAGNSLVLAAGGNFLNTGAAALSAGSNAGADRWLVYAASPAGINKGGLISGFRHYGGNYGSYGPGSVAESNNGFIYASAAGALTATVQHGTATHIYGDTPTTFSIALSGFVDSEDNAGNIGLAGSATYSGAPSNLSNAGSYSVNYSSGLTSGAGYTFAAGAALPYNVAQRSLTLTADPQSMTYGNGVPTLTYVTGGLGLVNGDTLSGALATTASATASVGSYAITQGSLAASGNYSVTAFTPNNVSIAQRSLTVATMSAVTKIYDGNTSVAALPASTFGNYVNGDNANLSLSGGSGSYDTRHVGNGKTVSYSALVLGGSAAGNYSLSGTTASGTGSITPLSSITWTGGGGSNWSNAANWGGIIVDGSNVLNANLAGNSVTYDAPSGATSLATLSNVGGLTLSGGTLGVGGNITTPAYVQTGGLLNGAGSLSVTTSFSKSGGTLAMTGPLSIAQASGNLAFTNDAPLNLGAVSTVSGAIDIDVTGGLSTSADPVSANGGLLRLTARSPITIGNGGLSATGTMSLSALTPSPASTITIGGHLTAGGTVMLDAYAGIAQNASISGQNISLATSTGNIVVASGVVSTVPTGGSINYSALGGTITSTAANFAGATPTLASSGGAGTNTSSTTNDINKAVSDATTTLTDEKTVTLETSTTPPTETTGGRGLLSTTTQTTGGETGTFGASEPIGGAVGTVSTPVSDATPAEGPAPVAPTAKAEDKPAADKEKDEKSEAKKRADRTDGRKEERRAATRKVAQCT